MAEEVAEARSGNCKVAEEGHGGAERGGNEEGDKRSCKGLQPKKRRR